MYKLTIEIDLDLRNDPEGSAQIIQNLMDEMQRLETLVAVHDLRAMHASGLVLNPLDDDALVGNWRIDKK